MSVRPAAATLKQKKAALALNKRCHGMTQENAAQPARGLPRCEPCQSFHAEPRDAEHKAALQCVAP